jgi:hypothetical protein
MLGYCLRRNLPTILSCSIERFLVVAGSLSGVTRATRSDWATHAPPAWHSAALLAHATAARAELVLAVVALVVVKALIGSPWGTCAAY